MTELHTYTSAHTHNLLVALLHVQSVGQVLEQGVCYARAEVMSCSQSGDQGHLGVQQT